MTALPTAHWPLPSLLRSLARAGWGELDGATHRGLRNVLRALSDQLPDGSATGMTTAPQLADASGYSVRWVEQCLRALERLGLIEWHRGGVSNRQARPSVIRVVKARLVALILAARPELAARVAARAKATARRLAALPREHYQARRSARIPSPEVAAGPHPPRGGTTPPTGVRGVRPAPAPHWRELEAQARAEAAPIRRLRVGRDGRVIEL